MHKIYMDLDKVTLECLVNPTLYKKYIKKRANDDNTDNIFYKERIIDLTKKLFDHKSEYEGLNEAFNSYINECITHLYACDMTSTYQQEYYDICLNNAKDVDSLFDISNSNQYIVKKKPDTKITKFIKKNPKPKAKYPVKRDFNPKDSKFKEPQKI